jgi:hypothetical protein
MGHLFWDKLPITPVLETFENTGEFILQFWHIEVDEFGEMTEFWGHDVDGPQVPIF